MIAKRSGASGRCPLACRRRSWPVALIALSAASAIAVGCEVAPSSTQQALSQEEQVPIPPAPPTPTPPPQPTPTPTPPPPPPLPAPPPAPDAGMPRDAGAK